MATEDLSVCFGVSFEYMLTGHTKLLCSRSIKTLGAVSHQLGVVMVTDVGTYISSTTWRPCMSWVSVRLRKSGQSRSGWAG